MIKYKTMTKSKNPLITAFDLIRTCPGGFSKNTDLKVIGAANQSASITIPGGWFYRKVDSNKVSHLVLDSCKQTAGTRKNSLFIYK